MKEFCQWLVTGPEGLAVEEQFAYKTLILTYNIVNDEEVKELMGRKVWKPDYDKLAGYLHEGMPPEIREKFVQAFLGADSPEVGAQKILGVDSPEVGAQKILGVDSPEEGVRKLLGVDSIEEAVKKLQERQDSRNDC